MVIPAIPLYLKKMVKSEEVEQYAKHEEADTRMIYHVGQLPSGTNVVMRTVDTNVVVIGLGCFHQLQNKRIWVESGVQFRNNLRYISINQLFHQLGEPLYKELPFYHAFTGCDYTSSLNRKEKVKPFKLLEKYSLSQSSTSRDLCYQVQTKKGSVSFNQIQAKKLNLSIILPCSKALHQKIKRFIYVASIQRSSPRTEPTGDVAPRIAEVIKDDSCTGNEDFSNSKMQRRLLQNNGDTNFNHSVFFLISSNQKLFFNFL